MTDTRRDRIARVMRDHDDTDSDCSCGWEWAGFGLWRDAYSHHVADAVIAELRAAGYAIVELPEPMTDLSNVAAMLAKSPNFQVGDSWACLCPDGTIEFETAQQKHYGIVSPSGARELAVALLAAADAAEREQ